MLVVDAATPTEIQTHVAKSFTLAKSGISTRITTLELARLVRRQSDGTVVLADPAEVERIVQAAHRLAFHQADEVGDDEKAAHALLARHLNTRDVPLDFVVSDIVGAQPSTERMELLDDVVAKTEWHQGAESEPPEPPELTLQRRVPRRRPEDWPAVAWVSEREHSRTADDLIEAPARYLAAPARLLIISIDWCEFEALSEGWVRRYGNVMDAEFARLAITDEIKLLVEAVLAPAIMAAERDPLEPPAITGEFLLEAVQAALPKVDEQLKLRLRNAWGRPRARR